MLFGDPGRTVTGCPYDETDTSSEDMMDGGGEDVDVWLVPPDTPMKADEPPPLLLSASALSPPRKPRSVAPQPPSASTRSRSRLYPGPRWFGGSHPRDEDVLWSPLPLPLPLPPPFRSDDTTRRW
ncbi:unnamed protein product [Ectocarpus fasciculatus]